MENKKAILVISFGTSYKNTRKKTIEACESLLRESFVDYDFYSAWTSKIIIKKLAGQGETIYYPSQMLDKLKDMGYEEVLIQSLHIINGQEYDKMMKIVDSYRDSFKKIIVGRPLLSSLEDYDRLTDFMEKVSKMDNKEEKKSVTLWMGHGTEHVAHTSYAALEYRLRKREINSYIGTVEGHPSIEDVIYFLKRDGIEKINLRPLLLVAGEHAKKDMAGQDDDSWKNILKGQGFGVNVHLEGIGEFEEIQNMFLDHAREAVGGIHE